MRLSEHLATNDANDLFLFRAGPITEPPENICRQAEVVSTGTLLP